MKERFRRHKNGYTLDIKVIPNAGKDELSVTENGLVVRVRAIPDGGKANEAVIAVLSKSFGIPKTHIEILKGQTGRRKTILFGVQEIPQLK